MAWIRGSSGLAVAIIATSGSEPASATWEFLEVLPTGTVPVPGTTAGGPGPGPKASGGARAQDRVAPSLSKLALASRSITLTRGRRMRVPRVRYRLSEPAQVRWTVLRRTVGRRVQGRCRAARAGTPRGRPCLRYVPTGVTVLQRAPAGPNTMPIPVRSGRRSLSAGTYRLVAVATDAAGNRSTARRVSFQVRSGR